MDINTIISLISSVGFPIVACILLAGYSRDTTDKIIALTRDVTDALVSSTRAIDEIKDVISKLGER